MTTLQAAWPWSQGVRTPAGPRVKVVTRVRPPAPPDIARHAAATPLLPLRGGCFTVDAALGAACSQLQLFACVTPLVNALLQGEDGVVLVYGAARTGKTYTLEGAGGEAGGECAGAISRAVAAVCDHLAVVPRSAYRLHLTACGLTAGASPHLYDLSAPTAQPAALKDCAAGAALGRLARCSVHNASDVAEVLQQVRLGRAAVAAVQPGCSRRGPGMLHTMFTLHLEAPSLGWGHKVASLSFVEMLAPEPKDLFRTASPPRAGPGRQLSAAYATLARVLGALRQQGRAAQAAAHAVRAPHIHWRDSGLTSWLQPRLSGARSVLVVATLSPSCQDATDTLATLAYVGRLHSARATQRIRWDVGAAATPAQHPALVGAAAGGCGGGGGSPACCCSALQVQRQTGAAWLPLVDSQACRMIGRPHRPTAATGTASAPWPPPSCSSPMVVQGSPPAGPSGASAHDSNSVAGACWADTDHARDVAAISAAPSASVCQPAGASAGRGASGARAGPDAKGCGGGAGVALGNWEAAAQGELERLVRLAPGGGARGVALLDQLLQELGCARAALATEQGERRGLAVALRDLRKEHACCDAQRRRSAGDVAGLERSLEAAQRRADKASADRALFLQRVHQLELLQQQAHTQGADTPAAVGSEQALNLQCHLRGAEAQVDALGRELAAMAAANQQLRQQCERTDLAAAEAVAAGANEATNAQQTLEEAWAQERSRSEAAERALAAAEAERRELAAQVAATCGGLDMLSAELQAQQAARGAAEAQVCALQRELQQRRVDAALEACSGQTAAVADAERETEALRLQLAEVAALHTGFEAELQQALPGEWEAQLAATSALPQAAAPGAQASSTLLSRQRSVLDAAVRVVQMLSQRQRQGTAERGRLEDQVAASQEEVAALADEVAALTEAAEEAQRLSATHEHTVQALGARLREAQLQVRVREGVLDRLIAQLAACETAEAPLGSAEGCGAAVVRGCPCEAAEALQPAGAPWLVATEPEHVALRGVAALHARMASLTAQLADAQRQRRLAEAELERQGAQLRALEGRAEEAAGQVQRLQIALAAAQQSEGRLRGDAGEQQGRLAAAQNERRALQAQLAGTQRVLERVQQCVEERQDAERGAADAHAKVESLRSLLEDARSEAQRLAGELRVAAAARDAWRDTARQHEAQHGAVSLDAHAVSAPAVQAELLVARGELAAVKAALSSWVWLEAQEQAAALMEQLAGRAAVVESCQQQVHAADAARAAAEQRASVLAADLLALQQQLAGAQLEGWDKPQQQPQAATSDPPGTCATAEPQGSKSLPQHDERSPPCVATPTHECASEQPSGRGSSNDDGAGVAARAAALQRELLDPAAVRAALERGRELLSARLDTVRHDARQRAAAPPQAPPSSEVEALALLVV